MADPDIADTVEQLPGDVGEQARSDYAATPLSTETPADATARQYAQDTATRSWGRVKAADLSSRGIPSFTTTSGDVKPYTDSTGSALTDSDPKNGVAYDSSGNAVSYSSRNPTRTPVVKDAYDGAPTQTDKQGNIYATPPGLPWVWKGVDPAIAANAAQQQSDKLNQKASSALAPYEQQAKVAASQADKAVAQSAKATSQIFTQHGAVISDVDGDPIDLKEVDGPTLKGALENSFNKEYAAPAANETSWMSGSLSSSAQSIRQDIDTRKQAAMSAADAHIDKLTQAQTANDNYQQIQQQRIALQSQKLDSVNQSRQAAGMDPVTIPGLDSGNSNQTAASGSDAVGNGSTATPGSVQIPGLEQPSSAQPTAPAAPVQPSLYDRAKNFLATTLGGLAEGVGSTAKGAGELLSKSQDPSLLFLPGGFINAPQVGLKLLGIDIGKGLQTAGSALQSVPGLITDPAFKDDGEAKAGRFIGGAAAFIGGGELGAAAKAGRAAVLIPALFSSGYAGQHDAAQEHFAQLAQQGVPVDPEQAEETAHRAGLLGGAINSVLGIPLEGAGKVIAAMFGKAAPTAVQAAFNNAFASEGAQGVANLLTAWKTAVSSLGTPAAEAGMKDAALQGLAGVIKEIQTSTAQRVANVAGRAIRGATLGAGTQVAQNAVTQTYDPSQSLTQGVGGSALAFGAMDGLFGAIGERQASNRANANRAGIEQIQQQFEKPVQGRDISPDESGQGAKPEGPAPRTPGGAPAETAQRTLTQGADKDIQTARDTKLGALGYTPEEQATMSEPEKWSRANNNITKPATTAPEEVPETPLPKAENFDKLADMGYSHAEIEGMSPTEADRRVRQNIAKPSAPTVVEQPPAAPQDTGDSHDAAVGKLMRDGMSVADIAKLTPEQAKRMAFPAPAIEPQRAPAGGDSSPTFKTSKGSEYTVDENGNTTRLKKSIGKGQNQVHEASPAVYLSPAGHDAIMDAGQAGHRVVLADRQSDGSFKQIRPESGQDIRNMSDPHVLAMSRQTGDIQAAAKATTSPEVGKHPFEISYNGDQKSFHMGNDITEIRATVDPGKTNIGDVLAKAEADNGQSVTPEHAVERAAEGANQPGPAEIATQTGVKLAHETPRKVTFEEPTIGRTFDVPKEYLSPAVVEAGRDAAKADAEKNPIHGLGDSPAIKLLTGEVISGEDHLAAFNQAAKQGLKANGAERGYINKAGEFSNSDKIAQKAVKLAAEQEKKDEPTKAPEENIPTGGEPATSGGEHELDATATSGDEPGASEAPTRATAQSVTAQLNKWLAKELKPKFDLLKTRLEQVGTGYAGKPEETSGLKTVVNLDSSKSLGLEIWHDPEALAHSVNVVQRNWESKGDSPEDAKKKGIEWMKMAMEEELYHASQKVSDRGGPQWEKTYSSFWKSHVHRYVREAVSALRSYAGESYADLAAELERMIMQYREHGTITEALSGNPRDEANFGKIKHFLASQQTPEMEDNIARVMTTVAEPPESISSPESQSPEESPKSETPSTQTERGPPERIDDILDSHIADLEKKRSERKLASAKPAAVIPGLEPVEAEPFYSQLLRTVESLPQETMTVGQARAAIEKGAKPDEIKMSGILTDTLSPLHQKQPNDKVTRAALKDYAIERSAKVQDVTLGGHDQSALNRIADEIRDKHVGSFMDFADPNGGEADYFNHSDNDDEPPVLKRLHQGNSDSFDDLIGEAAVRLRKGDIPSAKKSIEEAGQLEREYGDDPVKRSLLSDIEDAANETHFESYQLPGAEPGTYREQFVTWPNSMLSTEEQARLSDLTEKAKARGSNPQSEWTQADAAERASLFGKGSGWSDGHSQYSSIQNPIVRLRRNIRTDADGNKTLFLEEMQGPSKENQDKMPPELRKRIYEIGMKRAIREAAEEGATHLGWTTGEQQAERYDLSKHLDKVHIGKDPGGKLFNVYGEKDGASVVEHSLLTPQELVNTIGKELASKAEDLQPGELRTFEGEGLKIGGEGLKNLYDVTLPRIANEIAKKFGGKVGKAGIPTGGGYDTRGIDTPWIVEDRNGQRVPMQNPLDENEAERIARENGGRHYEDETSGRKNPEQAQIHSLELPTALRSKAMNEGFPLFASKPAPAESSEFYAEMSKEVRENDSVQKSFKPHAEQLTDIIEAYKEELKHSDFPTIHIADVMERAGFAGPTMSLGKSNLMWMWKNGLASLTGTDWSLVDDRKRAWGIRQYSDEPGTRGVSLGMKIPDKVVNSVPGLEGLHAAKPDNGGVGESESPRENLMREAEKAGVIAKADEIKGILRGDKAVMDAVRAKIKARTGEDALWAAKPLGVKLDELSEKTGLTSLIDAIQKVATPANRLTPEERKRFAETGDFNAIGDAKKTSYFVEQFTARAARKQQQRVSALREARALVQTLPDDQKLEYMLRVDEGTPIKPGPYKSALDALEKMDRMQVEAAKASFTELGMDHWKNFENYLKFIVPHNFENADEANKVVDSMIAEKKRILGDTSFLKHRSDLTMREVIDYAKSKGIELKPKTLNLVDSMMNRWYQQDRFFGAHEMIQSMEKNGTGHWVDSNEHYIAKRGEVPVNRIIGTRTVEGADGKRKKQEFYANEPSAAIVNNYLSHGLREGHKFIDHYFKAANVLNASQLGLSAFHGFFITVEGIVSSFALGLEKVLKGNPNGFKDMALAPFSTWHDWKLGKDVRKTLLDPTKGSELHRHIVDTIVDGGFRDGVDSFYFENNIQKFMDALKGHKIFQTVFRAPLALVELAAKPIMEHFVPLMKAAAVYKIAAHILENKPDMDPMDFSREIHEAVRSGNNRFGQLTYDNLHLNKVVKDLGMGMQRSMGWNVGSVGEILGGIGDWIKFARDAARHTARRIGGGGKGGKPPEGGGENGDDYQPGGVKFPRITHRMAYTLALPIIVGFFGLLLAAMFGQPIRRLRDLYTVPTGEVDDHGHKVYVSLPSYMRDVLSWSKDPMHAVVSKLHPLLSMIGEMLQNRDYYGVAIRNSGDPVMKQIASELKFLGKQFEPFSFANAGKLKGSEVSPSLKIATQLGALSVAPSAAGKTDAENLADELNRESIPTKERTQEQADHSKLIGQIIGLQRIGKGSELMQQSVASGKLSQKDIAYINRQSILTPLQASVKKLSAVDAEKVARVATPTEINQIRPLIAAKDVRAGRKPFFAGF